MSFFNIAGWTKFECFYWWVEYSIAVV